MLAHAVQLKLQDRWKKWYSVFRMNLCWTSCFSMPPSLLSFCLRATYNTLPSPSNLHRCNISPEISCQLCHKEICTTAHILRACKVALQLGRFTFWHDSVLHVLLSTVQSFLSLYTVSLSCFDTLIKKPEHSIKKRIGLLHFASGWILQCDHLHNKLVIPSFIVVNQLRLDIILYFISTKTVNMLELTCPFEENMEVWYNKKFEKCHPLSLAMVSNGLLVHLFLIEVGAGGYYSATVKSCLMKLLFSTNLDKSTLK